MIARTKIESGTTSDLILTILAEDFPLSAKEIFYRTKKITSKNLTYQAVHKTLQQLSEKRILTKKEGKYRIQKEWVENIRDHLTILERQHHDIPSPKKVLEEIKKRETKLNFTSLTTMSVFTAELLATYRESIKKPVPNYAFIRHAWWPLKFEPRHYIAFKKMDDGNLQNRVVVIQDSPFDQWILKYYMLVTPMLNPSERLRCIPKAKWSEDLIVKGDMIIQTSYSRKTLKRIDQIYQRVANLTDLFDLYFVNVEKDEEFEIEMKIQINPTLAKLIREKIDSYFK